MKVILEATHKRILEIYAEYINKWKALFYIPVDEKLNKGTYWLKYLDLKKEEVVKIRSKIKFVNQWVFIEATERIVISGLQHANILKMAKGKFVPWSEAEKWYGIHFVHIIHYSLEIISGKMKIRHSNGMSIQIQYWSKDLI